MSEDIERGAELQAEDSSISAGRGRRRGSS